MDPLRSANGALVIKQTRGGIQVRLNPSAFGAPLTRANDTNVTLTLNGSPLLAVLAGVELALGWTGTLSVARGGTGQGSFSPALLNAALTSGRIPAATTGGRLTDGPAPVADGTYNFDAATPGNVKSITFTKGIATAVSVL